MGYFDCIKILDIFGYEVKIKVDKQNEKHKTLTGSCFSIIYFGMVMFVFYICANDSAVALTETIY